MTAVKVSPPLSTFFIIATKSQKEWHIVYSIALKDRPLPYVQAGGMDKSLEIGSIRSDKQAITVFWDPTSQKYIQSNSGD